MKRSMWFYLSFLFCSVGIVVGAEGLDGPAHEVPKYDGSEPDMSKPVQVYILLGQSNMLGFGKVAGSGEGTLEYAVKEKGLYPYLVDADGNWIVRKDVRNVRVMNDRQFNNEWMTLGNGNIGPEIGIGHHLGNAIDAPVMVLKSCIGNRSLGWDLLPPGTPSLDGEPGYRGTSDNPEMSEEIPAGAGWYAGKQYDGDIGAAKRVLADLDSYVPGANGYEVAGFFWWQGDKDMRNANHSKNYEDNLVRLIKALRNDFDAPNAKFVAATLGQTKKDTGGGQGKIRDAMFAVADHSKYPEFKGQTAAVFTHPLSKGGSSSGHYNKHAETYMNVGEAMGWAMVEMLGSGGGGRSSSASRSQAGSFSAGSTRGPRKITLDNFEKLQQALLQTLVMLNNAGKLEQTPLRTSFTSASVWLKSAGADGTLTFGMVGSDRTANLPWSSVSPEDQAVLAMLVASLSPESGDAQGLAGIYAEILGQVPVAQSYFSKAGSARAKWEALLQ